MKNVKLKDPLKTTIIEARFSAKQMRDSQLRVNEWQKKNYAIATSHGFEYYYLYALERFMSFRDLIEHTPEKEWYDQGVEYLRKHQAKDGSFEDGCGTTADTAFALLFLVRSSKKAIEKAKNLGAGFAIGGRGLPKPGERLEMQNGVLVIKQESGSADDLLKMFDDAEDADYEKALEMMSKLPSQQVESLMAAHGNKLRQLTRDQEPDARMAAVIALGKTRDLDNVPPLIYALTDSDREVVIEARRSLERVSRNPAGFGPLDDFNSQQRQDAIKKWKAWYLSLRPDAELDF